jgi:hypothetical protein
MTTSYDFILTLTRITYDKIGDGGLSRKIFRAKLFYDFWITPRLEKVFMPPSRNMHIYIG